MEEIIKIATNGQWTLEKSQDVEAFLAAKKAREAKQEEDNKPKPSLPKKDPREGLQAVSHQTGNNPDFSKEQVARQRQALLTEEAKNKKQVVSKPAPVTPIAPVKGPGVSIRRPVVSTKP